VSGQSGGLSYKNIWNDRIIRIDGKQSKEAIMTLLEQIESQLRQLPPEKQHEVLDFITSL
jgi:hypothetical protein